MRILSLFTTNLTVILTVLLVVAGCNSNGSSPASAASGMDPDVARESNGEAKNMNQMEAAKFCAGKRGRLPTVRELVPVAMSHGAKGIVDSCGSDPKCYLIQATNSDGSSDNFYYSYSGFRLHSGEQSDDQLWSSSADLKDINHAGWVFALNGSFGYFDEHSTFEFPFGTVRCIVER